MVPRKCSSIHKYYAVDLPVCCKHLFFGDVLKMLNSDFPQQKGSNIESLNLLNQRELLLHRFKEISGMTFLQFRVFQHLKANGMKSASQISKELEIPKTNTNAVLRSMYEKGLIKLKNYQPYRFYAVSIREFLLKSIMSDYKKLVELEKILDLLSKQTN